MSRLFSPKKLLNLLSSPLIKALLKNKYFFQIHSGLAKIIDDAIKEESFKIVDPHA